MKRNRPTREKKKCDTVSEAQHGPLKSAEVFLLTWIKPGLESKSFRSDPVFPYIL